MIGVVIVQSNIYIFDVTRPIIYYNRSFTELYFAARDIQAWEYVPLGPFLGKNFGKMFH
jgi:hypothetical protein